MGPLTKITKLIKFWFHNKFKDLLCLGKEKPKAAPGGKLLLLREVELHLLGGIAGVEGCLVTVCSHLEKVKIVSESGSEN